MGNSKSTLKQGRSQDLEGGGEQFFQTKNHPPPCPKDDLKMEAHLGASNH